MKREPTWFQPDSPFDIVRGSIGIALLIIVAVMFGLFIVLMDRD